MQKESKWLAVIFVLLLLIPLVNASFFTDIANWITGRATSGSHTVSIALGNTAPNITNMTFETTTLTPVQGTYAVLNFSFLVNDPDGTANVDTTYGVANASIFGSGNYTRSNSSCKYVAVVGSNVNFSCQIIMWYFDPDDRWNITIQARDISLEYTQNRSNYFTFSTLTSYDFGPASMSFTGVTAGSSNKTATRSYLVNNSGNDNTKTLSINASNLFNTTAISQAARAHIAANNFTVDIETGTSAECDIGGLAFSLFNSTYVNVTGSNVYRGNFTWNNGTGQRKLYYCLNNVSATLLSATYDTSQFGPWYAKVVS